MRNPSRRLLLQAVQSVAAALYPSALTFVPEFKAPPQFRPVPFNPGKNLGATAAGGRQVETVLTQPERARRNGKTGYWILGEDGKKVAVTKRAYERQLTQRMHEHEVARARDGRAWLMELAEGGRADLPSDPYLSDNAAVEQDLTPRPSGETVIIQSRRGVDRVANEVEETLFSFLRQHDPEEYRGYETAADYIDSKGGWMEYNETTLTDNVSGVWHNFDGNAVPVKDRMTEYTIDGKDGGTAAIVVVRYMNGRDMSRDAGSDLDKEQRGVRAYVSEIREYAQPAPKKIQPFREERLSQRRANERGVLPGTNFKTIREINDIQDYGKKWKRTDRGHVAALPPPKLSKISTYTPPARSNFSTLQSRLASEQVFMPDGKNFVLRQFTFQGASTDASGKERFILQMQEANTGSRAAGSKTSNPVINTSVDEYVLSESGVLAKVANLSFSAAEASLEQVLRLSGSKAKEAAYFAQAPEVSDGGYIRRRDRTDGKGRTGRQSKQSVLRRQEKHGWGPLVLSND